MDEPRRPMRRSDIMPAEPIDMRDLAPATPHPPSTALDPEDYLLVARLVQVAKAVTDRCELAVNSGEPPDWSEIAGQLGQVGRECMRRAITAIDLDDIGDSGGR